MAKKLNWMRISLGVLCLIISVLAALECLTRTEVERDLFKEFSVHQLDDNSGRLLAIHGRMWVSMPVNLNHITQSVAGDVLTFHIFSDGLPFQAIRIVTRDDRPLNINMKLPTYIKRVEMGQKKYEVWPTDLFQKKFGSL